MGTTSATASPANVRPVTMPFVDRLASAVVTAVPPIMVAVGMWFGWMGNLLDWQDLLILAVCYFGDRHGGDRRLPPPADAPSFKCHRSPARRFAALGSAAAEGPGDRLGRDAPQAPPVLRRRRRPAQPARRPRLRLARRVQRARARAHRLGVQRHGGRRRAPLRQGPARRPVDPVRRPARSCCGSSRGSPWRSGSASRSAAPSPAA